MVAVDLVRAHDQLASSSGAVAVLEHPTEELLAVRPAALAVA